MTSDSISRVSGLFIHTLRRAISILRNQSRFGLTRWLAATFILIVSLYSAGFGLGLFELNLIALLPLVLLVISFSVYTTFPYWGKAWAELKYNHSSSTLSNLSSAEREGDGVMIQFENVANSIRTPFDEEIGDDHAMDFSNFDRGIIFLVAIDVLDEWTANVLTHVRDEEVDFPFNFERVQMTLGGVTYYLQDPILGSPNLNLGFVKLSKIDDHSTELRTEFQQVLDENRIVDLASAPMLVQKMLQYRQQTIVDLMMMGLKRVLSSKQSIMNVGKMDRRGNLIDKPGRPGLLEEELINRLAKAQAAIEIKSQDPEKTWKEIAQEVNWPNGREKRGIKLLEDARKRLKHASPELLGKVKDWREKKEKK